MTKSLKRLVLTLALTIMGIPVASTITAPAALAAPCWGSSCENKDPAITGCSSGATATSPRTPIIYQGQNVGWIEQRYSYACNSNWARGYLSRPIPGFSLKVTQCAERQTGPYEPGFQYGGTWYTNMTDGYPPVKAEVLLHTGGGNYWVLGIATPCY
jgi:hypothetical protein